MATALLCLSPFSLLDLMQATRPPGSYFPHCVCCSSSFQRAGGEYGDEILRGPCRSSSELDGQLFYFGGDDDANAG